MWPYFGTKLNKAKYYPPPIYDTIIEPFAGAAGYSMRHYKKNVILLDKDKKISLLWRYLQKAQAADILNLPHDFQDETDLRNFDIPDEARWLLGFMVFEGTGHTQNIITQSKRINLSRLKKISKRIEHIRHWKIINADYHAIQNIEATWFIDPPYKGRGGLNYPCNNKKIDYDELAEWCKSRKGQVIVCEYENANWLPFKPMNNYRRLGVGNARKHRHKTTEMIWSNLETVYDYEQLSFLED